MTAVTADRYLLPHDGVGPGHDQLLDLPITAVRLVVPEPERLARGLRALPDSPWLRVLDAFSEPTGGSADGSASRGAVVLVLPRTRAVLADELAAGLPEHRADVLAATLPEVLDQLAALGLGPASLRPEQVGVADDGQLLLVPQPGRVVSPEDSEQLLARLQRHSGVEPVHQPPADPGAPEPAADPGPPEPALDPGAPEPAVEPGAPEPALDAGGSVPAAGRSEQLPPGVAEPALDEGGTPAAPDWSRPLPQDAPEAAQEDGSTSSTGPAEPPVLPVPLPTEAQPIQADRSEPTVPADRDGQPQPAPPARHGSAQLPLRAGAAAPRPRAGRGHATLLAVAAALSVLAVGVALFGAGQGPAPADVLAVEAAPAAAAPLEGVTRRLAADPDAVGEDGPYLLLRLQGLAVAPEARRSLVAADVLEAIRTGRQQQTLRGGLVDEVERVVTALAAPVDLGAFLALVREAPASFGPGAPALTQRLQQLQDELTGESARVEAQRLIGVVEDAAAKGQVSRAFETLAVPVLRDLAVPDDVDALVRVVLDDPDRFGPGGLEFLGRLQKLQTLDGAAAAAEAADLVELVTAAAESGALTPALRDIAVPVLRTVANSAPTA